MTNELVAASKLGRQLQLGPQDIHPLDLEFDQEWKGPDDPAWRVGCGRSTSSADLTKRSSRSCIH
jgi:hypothetical protein